MASTLPTSNGDDDVVVRVLSNSYETELQEKFVQTATRALTEDARLRDACLLQPRDTEQVYVHNATLRVVKPQAYERVSTLRRTSSVFTSPYGDYPSDDGCYGSFFVYNGNAVTGSGSDEWYKVTPELVDFCKTVDQQACALVMDSASDDIMLSFLENSLESTKQEGVRIAEELARARLMLSLLHTAREKNEADVFQAQQAIAKRKIELLSPSGGTKRRLGELG